MSTDRTLRASGPWPRALAACLVASALACAAPGAWASPQPMIEPDRVQLLPESASASADPAVLHRAILDAASQRAWQIQDDQPGKVLMVAVTGIHVAAVDVIYDGSGFQVKYLSSVEMDYAVDDGHRVIHPRYNRWITTLSNEIRRSAVFSRKPRAPAASDAR